MKNSGILGLVILFAVSCSDNKYNVEIRGNVTDAPPKNTTVYIEDMNTAKPRITDSAVIKSGGKFKLRLKTKGPGFYHLGIGHKNILLLVEPHDKIDVTTAVSAPADDYRISGSENSELIRILNRRIRRTISRLDSLLKIYEALLLNNREERIRIGKEWEKTLDEQRKYSADFIREHISQPVIYYALYQKINENNPVFDPVGDIEIYKTVASAFGTKYPESIYTRSLAKRIEDSENIISNIKWQEIIAKHKSDLPPIELPDKTGRPVSLHSFKGKYILLEFSVLTAEGSAAYIKQLQKTYEKYKNKGLTIYQVCLDNSRLIWEDAQKVLNIQWTCVWDENAMKSVNAGIWNIKHIPANYLIDKEFNIVGKNLFGNTLEERLNHVIK